jgi:hypothetical protein
MTAANAPAQHNRTSHTQQHGLNPSTQITITKDPRYPTMVFECTALQKEVSSMHGMYSESLCGVPCEWCLVLPMLDFRLVFYDLPGLIDGMNRITESSA